MDQNKFTQKTQLALSDAQNKAVRYGQIEVDGEQLLMALCEQVDGLFARIIKRMGVEPEAFTRAVEEELQKKPKVSGPGVEAGKIYVTQRLNQILVQAEAEAKRLK